MNPLLIDEMGWRMAEVYGSITDRILVNLARRFPYIHHDRELMGSFAWQAKMLAEMGQVRKESIAIIAASLGGEDEALQKALETAIFDALEKEEPALQKAAKAGYLAAPTTRPELSPNQMQAFKLYYQQSADKLNLVNTVMLESTEAAYTSAVSDAVGKISRTQGIVNAAAGETITGVSAWNTAMHDAVAKMVSNGLTGLIDHAGHRWSPEAYVAMDIRTTMFNTARAAVWERNQDFGNDVYQVSTKSPARPLCYPWQGKLLSSTGYVREVPDLDGNMIPVHSEDEVESFRWGGGLFGVNCGHYPMPFIPGLSVIRGEPMDQEANDKLYELTQQQRQMERDLRQDKLDLAVMKSQGASDDAILAQRQKVSKQEERLNDFCKANELPRRKNREYTPVNATFPDTLPPRMPTAEQNKIRDWFTGGNNPDGNNPNINAPVSDNQPPVQQAQLINAPRHADFVPSQTIEEAEAQARKYVVERHGTASYKGIDLQYANTCNRVLGDINATYDVRQLGSIQPMNMRTKEFRGSTAEAAYGWGGIGGNLYINPTYYKSKSAFKAHKTEIDQLTEKVLNNGDRLLSTATGMKRDYIEALLSTKRQCVSQSYDFVEGTFVHECGHRLDDNLFYNKIKDAFGGSNTKYAELLSESRMTYGKNISGYAVTNSREYIAESFTAWWFGEGDKIDPVIRAVFEGEIKG